MIIIRLFSRLPFPVLYLLSDFTAFLLYRVVGYRKKVVKDNLQKSFPEKSEREIKKITRKFYRHLTDVFFETLKALTISPEALKKRVVIQNRELPEKYISKGQSIVVIVSHVCNWEWLLLANCTPEFKVDGLYKQLSSKFFDKLMLTIRSRFGAHLIEMQKTLRETVARKNIPRAVSLIADQSASESEANYWTTFLGRETVFYNGPEKLARMMQYPVLNHSMRRIKRGHYEADFTLLAEPPYTKEDPLTVIEKYKTELEEVIRLNPSDWLWSHRRWKHQRKKR